MISTAFGAGSAKQVARAVGTQLRGRPCRPYNSDTKLRIRLADQTRFYYPDAQIVCRQNPPGDHFQDEPAVVFEVVSESTRRIDEIEKRGAYLTIPTLNAYVLIEQDRPAATVWRRASQGFVREDYAGAEAVIRFDDIALRYPRAARAELSHPSPT